MKKLGNISTVGLIILLVLVMIVVLAYSTFTGAVSVPFDEVVRILLNKIFGYGDISDIRPATVAIVWQLYAPRSDLWSVPDWHLWELSCRQWSRILLPIRTYWVYRQEHRWVQRSRSFSVHPCLRERSLRLSVWKHLHSSVRSSIDSRIHVICGGRKDHIDEIGPFRSNYRIIMRCFLKSHRISGT